MNEFKPLVSSVHEHIRNLTYLLIGLLRSFEGLESESRDWRKVCYCNFERTTPKGCGFIVEM